MTPEETKKKIYAIMDNHHCIVTDDLGRRCVDALAALLDELRKESGEHVHNWQLAKYVSRSVIDGSSYAILICECGGEKMVDTSKEKE